MLTMMTFAVGEKGKTMDEYIRKQTVLNMIDDVQFGNITNKLSRLHEAVNSYPPVDVVEVVRCIDCKYRPYGEEHDYVFPLEYRCPCQCDDNWHSWMPKDDFFCGNGERKTNE